MECVTGNAEYFGIMIDGIQLQQEYEENLRKAQEHDT